MTRAIEPNPGLEADDVVRRLRGALDELTADISETTVADRPTARVHELRQRSGRRTWLVPAAAAAAVVAVVAGVVVVGNRDDGGPSGPSVSVPDTTAGAASALEDSTVAGATFAAPDGLEPAGVPTFNTVMTAPLGAVWMSADGPDDWFVAVRQESDRGLPPGTMEGGIELEPVDVDGRMIYVDPGDAGGGGGGGGGATVYEWRPDGEMYIVEAFGLSTEALVEFAASIQPGSGVPFILMADDPEFAGAEASILDPQPTYLSQPWTLDGAAVRLSAATGGLARHLADLAASTTTVASITVAGESGYRIEATDGTHALWPSAASGNVWVSATIPTNDRVDDVIGSLVQEPTGLVVGGRRALAAGDQTALRGWRTTVVEGEVPRPSRPVGRPLAERVDGLLDGSVSPSAPLILDALTFHTVEEIEAVALDVAATRRVVLVTDDFDSPERDAENEALRALAARTENILIADWDAAVEDEATSDDLWIEIVAAVVLVDEGDG